MSAWRTTAAARTAAVRLALTASVPGTQEAPLLESRHDARALLGRALADGRQHDVRALRGLVRVVDAGEALQLPLARLSPEPLHVARLAKLGGRVDEDLEEPVAAHHRAHLGARGAVRADRRADRDAAVAHDLRGHPADAADV